MSEPVVRVVWWDAWYDDDYADESDFADEFVVETVGFLARRGEHAISIASERQPDQGKARWRSVTHIPWPMVIRVEDLDAQGINEPIQNVRLLPTPDREDE